MAYTADFASHHNLFIKPRTGNKHQPFQNITRTARDILEYLWKLTDNGKKLAFPTQVTLAEEFCCTRMTIHRSLNQLQEKGYIFPAARTNFMVVQWAVSLTPKFMNQTIKTLPMVKHASQSIKDFLKSIKACVDKAQEKMLQVSNIDVTHTNKVLQTGSHSPLVGGDEPPSKQQQEDVPSSSEPSSSQTPRQQLISLLQMYVEKYDEAEIPADLSERLFANPATSIAYVEYALKTDQRLEDMI